MDSDLIHFHEINQTTRLMLKNINGKDSIETLAHQLVEAYGWPKTQVLHDFLTLIQTLNKRYLMNIDTPSTWRNKGKEMMVKLLVFFGTIQGDLWFWRKRYSLHHHSILVIWTIFLFFCKSYFFLIIGSGIFISIVLFATDLLNATSFIFIMVPIVASMTIHEYCHYLFYKLLDKERRTPFLGYALGKAQIVRTSLPPRSDMIVTIMGPLVPALLGSLLILIGIYLGDNTYYIWLAGIIFCTHLLFLIPPSQDGKKIFQLLINDILLKKIKERNRNR